MSMIGDLMKYLVQSNLQGGQVPAGQEGLPQAMSGLLGGAQGGQVLGLLEQMAAGSQPGSLPSVSPAANNTLLNLVQPMADELSRRTGLEPQMAQSVVSLILHRMLESHPAFGGQNARLNLPEVLQQMAASGSVNPDILHNSGMVNDLVRSHGMDQQAAMQNLNEVFNLLGSHVQNASKR